MRLSKAKEVSKSSRDKSAECHFKVLLDELEGRSSDCAGPGRTSWNRVGLIKRSKIRGEIGTPEPIEEDKKTFGGIFREDSKARKYE